MAPGLAATGCLLLLLFVLCEAARPMRATLRDQNSTHSAAIDLREEAGAGAGARELAAGTGCKAFDINIGQGEASGVGLPTWEVQITNSCLDPRCSISAVIVRCGPFASASLVDPAVFRRLDATQGTCIVKNGNAIGNGQTVTFRYQEVFMQPLSLQSAHVSCSG